MLKTETTVLNEGTEDELLCVGYRRSLPKTVIVVVLSIVSAGILQLIFYWMPCWRLRCTSSRCRLDRATKVLILNQYKEKYVVEVKTRPVSPEILQSLRPKSEPPTLTPCTHPTLTSNTSVNPESPAAPQESITDTNRLGVFYSASRGRPQGPVNAEVVMVTGEGQNVGRHSHLWSNSSIDSDEEIDDTRALINVKHKEKEGCLRFFEHQKLVYYWEWGSSSFCRLYALERNTPCSAIYAFHGYSEDQQHQRRGIYGRNQIDIEVPSYLKLFVMEILNPFYIFQILSFILWVLENYYIYGGCIIVILFTSLAISLYETKRQAVVLHDMVAYKSTLKVCRDGGDEEEIDSRDVVPGDVIIIPSHGCMMTCDAALISGNCIVNESMLTGESVPVTKTPLPNPPSAEGERTQYYSPDDHKRHTLFCGTKIIQTRYYGSERVKAVVVRTAFSTLKGDLVRSILFPKPVNLKFYEDSLKFIGLLAILATIGIVYTIVVLARSPIAETSDIIFKALDIITVAVPPALPAAMTVGMVYAQQRLKKGKVFCISPQRINVCGKLKLVCFDKTGTLTEDSLDMWGVVPVDGERFLPVVKTVSTLERGPFIAAMATCHSLTRIEGELAGDPLDLKMFEATDWDLEEPGPDTTRFDTLIPIVVKPKTEAATCVDPEDGKEAYEIGVVRQFTFSSSLQRMCVITRTLGAKNMDVYVKGAPEMVASLCDHTTVPRDFHEVLQRYTQMGFRVLALAWKPMSPKFSWHHAQKIQRNELECKLTFLGLLVMQNALKPVTTSIIGQLNAANIRTVMVTGDNMLTAISVARDCGMVAPKSRVIVIDAFGPKDDSPARIEWSYDTMPERSSEGLSSATEDEMIISMEMEHFHFAVAGKSFAVLKNHFPELMDKVVQRGAVYARMSPDQKTQLVEALQSLGYCVGMCGDGANDCGALKTAHAGISLSEAEASVASPFTSMVPDISCVPNVIREGRAALITSFGVFKYMALYSVIQFVSVMILYWIDSNLGDWQFLYVDLVITTTVAVLMGRNGAYPKLVKQRPPGSITNPTILISIVSEIMVVAVVQVTGYFLLFTQPWFTPLTSKANPDANIFCYENSVVFLVSSFQYIILAAAFSKGAPYRLPIWTNVLFLLALLILSLMTAVMMFLPVEWNILRNFLQLKQIAPQSLRFTAILAGLVLFNFLFAFVLESFVVDRPALKKFIRPLRCKRGPKNRYKLVEAEIRKDPRWPPLRSVR